MTDISRAGLQPLSHLKAGPTTSSSRSTARPSSTQPPSRPPSRLRSKRVSNKDDVDAAGEKATVALIRRVLCPQNGSYGASSPQSPEELLPPLTSSNDIDRQLYALLAIIIKEFVYSWYSKITSDQALVNEVLQVIAHCTRALEERLRQIDVAQLALDEIPMLVEAHVHSYRLARRQSHLSGLPTSHRVLYHELNPHPGLSPVPDAADPDTITEQSENESAHRRLLANGSLAVLLPTEDLENSSLRALVVDVIADLILGNQISGRACEGWFIWETITKLAVRGEKSQPDDTTSVPESQINRLEKFGLLSTDDEVQPASVPATAWIWNFLQHIYVGYVALRFIVVGLFRVASSPGPSHGVGVSVAATAVNNQKNGGIDCKGATRKRPVLDYRICSMVSQILGVPRRMPWLSGFLALFQHLILAGPGRVGGTDGILDRFLRETIEAYVLTPTLLPNLLRATRTALFPANARPSQPVDIGASAPQSVQTSSEKAVAPALDVPITEGVRGSHPTGQNNPRTGGNNGGPTAPTSLASVAADSTLDKPTETEKKARPSQTEIAAIKRRCAASLVALMPRTVARTFFGVPSPASPSPYSGDGTCSTNSSPYIATTSPPSIGGDGSWPQGNDPHASSHSAIPTHPGAESGHIPAERLRTDDQSVEIDLETVYLMEIIETDLLDVFADEYCNKHLVYSILEVVLAKVLPEMTENTVEDLMADRGVSSAPHTF
ncbi:unnamed protein product [Penicillium olsonii]|nr:unnamed protein product [Penicillium olsonii]